MLKFFKKKLSRYVIKLIVRGSSRTMPSATCALLSEQPSTFSFHTGYRTAPNRTSLEKSALPKIQTKTRWSRRASLLRGLSIQPVLTSPTGPQQPRLHSLDRQPARRLRPYLQREPGSRHFRKLLASSLHRQHLQTRLHSQFHRTTICLR